MGRVLFFLGIAVANAGAVLAISVAANCWALGVSIPTVWVAGGLAAFLVGAVMVCTAMSEADA